MTKSNLILLHGALGTKQQLAPLKALLNDQYEIHDFDLDGHGGRPVTAQFSIELFTMNLKEFIDAKAIHGTDIFGYSMGGYVALNLVKDRPTYLNKIVTLATKFNWTPETAQKEVKMLNPEIIKEKVPKFAEYLRLLHQPSDWKTVLDQTAKMMIMLGDQPVLTLDDFKKILNKVQVMVGDADMMVSLEETKLVDSLLPNSTLKILPEVQHPIEKVNTSKLAEIIKDALS